MQLVEGGVDGVQQGLVALVHRGAVLLLHPVAGEDGQALVGGHILLGGGLVDDDRVYLAVDQGLHGGGAVIVAGHMVLAVAAVLGGVGGVDVAGGATLGADHLLAQVVQGHVRALFTMTTCTPVA